MEGCKWITNDMDSEIYAISSAIHTVPHSPFLFKDCHSPAPQVPDIDTAVNRKLLCNDRRLTVLSTLTQNSQSGSQPQQLPSTPSVQRSKSENSIKRKINCGTSSIEQVVPSCSPFLEAEEKPCQQTRLTFEKKGRYPVKKNLAQSSTKRQNRNMDVVRNPSIKEINFLIEDEIFG